MNAASYKWPEIRLQRHYGKQDYKQPGDYRNREVWGLHDNSSIWLMDVGEGEGEGERERDVGAGVCRYQYRCRRLSHRVGNTQRGTVLILTAQGQKIPNHFWNINSAAAILRRLKERTR